MRDRFFGKTWIYAAQLIGCGGLGLFAVTFGILFWTGAMNDAGGEPRPQAGPPMVITGSALSAVAVLAAFNLAARVSPVIRCYREGIECNLIGATSLDGVPLVPGLVRVAWAVLSLQGFRSQRVRVAWSHFGGAHVGGLPMAYVLTLSGAFSNPQAAHVAHAILFPQVALADHPQPVADTLNFLAANPAARESLPPWGAILPCQRVARSRDPSGTSHRAESRAECGER